MIVEPNFEITSEICQFTGKVKAKRRHEMNLTVTVNGEQVANDDFQDFNWNNFEYGDIVWTEDESIDAVACVYMGEAGGVVELWALDENEVRAAIQKHIRNVHFPIF